MTKSNYDLDITKGDYSKTSLRFMYLNITNKCNLRCLYCYDEKSRLSQNEVNIPLEIYKSLASDSKKLGLIECV